MSEHIASSTGKVNPLPAFRFDVTDPKCWFRYVADWMVIHGKSRRTGEAYARDVRILLTRVEKSPFDITGEEVRDFILDRHSTGRQFPQDHVPGTEDPFQRIP